MSNAGMNLALEKIGTMLNQPLFNYAVPGLTSWMVGGENRGCVRVFISDRHQQEAITPHNHRFDLACYVMAGEVTNRIWTEKASGDQYRVSTLHYEKEPGKYTQIISGVKRFDCQDTTYRTGDWYSMTADEIHSIYFKRGTRVLFFEGPTKKNESTIIEPFVNEKAIQTFKVESWMFQKP